jgi:hypothetical protein
MMPERERSRESSFDDRGEAVRQVIARAAVELHPIGGPPNYEPAPIVFDLMQPQPA